MPKEYYLIEINRPSGVSIGEMTDYIEDAVGSMKGCKHPEDPIFYLDSVGLRVQHLTPSRIKRLMEKPKVKHTIVNMPKNCPPGVYSVELQSMKPIKGKPGGYHLKFKNVKPVEQL